MMKLKSATLLSRLALFLAVLGLLAFVPKADDTPLDKLIATLQKWTIDNPQEKVYLQIDKPYYALGDTIWFKGYVTVGSRHQLSAVSGSVYVDLINEQDSIIRSLKLPATSGMVMGDFTLSDEMKQGNYRIRAYTQWMRNAGEEYFFDKTVTVGAVFNNNIITKADYQYKDIDNKPVLTATLNYTDEQGKPLAEKSVLYRIMIDKKVVWTKNTKTDDRGNIQVLISNENKANLSGAYIRTILTNNEKKEVVKDFPIKAGLAQSDVQFFPESGNLLNGVISRIAFKALGVDGLGLNITGKVIDNENKEIADIITAHAGMGNFIFKPETGKSYTAKLNFADGSTKSIPLPKAVDEGYVLSVYQPNKDSILVRIYAKQPQQPVNLSLVAHSGGELIAASNLKIERPMTSVWMDKKDFPSGIAQFTLFNSNNQPLNERIAFIRSNDQLSLTIKPNKDGFKSKEPVFFTMDARNGNGKPTIGNFSVSVINETQIPAEEATESTILSNLLLTSDIKGYVEKPNYYFTKDSKEVNEALDNLMLTQGYRRFVWKDLSNDIAAKPIFPAQGLGINISGKVQTLSNKIVPRATVSMISLKAKVSKFTTADSLGHFMFDSIFLTDSIKFAIQGRGAKNTDKVHIILDSVPQVKMTKNPNIGDVSTDIALTLKDYIAAEKKQDEINEKMGRMDQVHRLRQVNIKAAKPKPEVYAIPEGGFVVPDGHADRTIIVKDIDKFPMFGVYLQTQSIGAAMSFRNYRASKYEPEVLMYPYMSGVPMKVVLNGRLLRPEEAAGMFDNTTLPIEDIAKIEVVGSTLVLYTIPIDQRKQYNPSITNVIPKGFNTAREFYMPKYSTPASMQSPDMRSTIYWNPYLKTDAAGKCSFSFFNGDGPAIYKVIVEGIDVNGQLGRQVFRYKVEGDLAMAAFTPSAKDEQAKQIAAAFDSLNKHLPAERVYLHTDKPYYNIGDTLWFKSYITDVHQLPSKQSGLLYVELDDDSTEAVRRVTVPIKDGVCWGQIPLPRKIFHEGGYTLRAYTNWMQNFGDDAYFTQRFYLGVPAQTAWLVKSSASIKQVNDKNQLDVDIRLNRGDRSALALRDVEVKIYEGKYYLLKEDVRTGVDGSFKLSKILKDKVDGRNLRVQITSLEKADNGKQVQVPLSINRPQKIDLQFLPEGGYLVAGLKSTVGFKAIGEDGKGADVSGSVYDSKGVKISDFATAHNGMGSFGFTPITGEKYSAKITQQVDGAKPYLLPAVKTTGTVMLISNPEVGENLSVSIAGITKMATDSAYYLIGTTGGHIYYSQKIDSDNPGLNIAKNIFPSGVTRFTLLRGHRPLNERVVFIDQKDQLDIKFAANKQVFKLRDSVGLEIEVKSKAGMPAKGSFSLSVTDNSLVKADTIGSYGITTGLLLNAALKGNIEDPGYYINRKDKLAWQALDNLMLTQGWTGYDWKDVFAPAKAPAFLAEKDIKISGNVVNAFNKPVANASVLISSQKPSFVKMIPTDGNGRFELSNLPKIDSGSFFIQGQNANGKNLSLGAVNVNRFKPPAIPEMFINSITPWYVNADTAQLNYVKRVAQKQDDANVKAAGTLLKNVLIKNARIIKNSMNPYGPGKSDLAFDEAEIKASGVMDLWQLLKQKLPGIELYGVRTLMFRDEPIDIPVFKWGEYWINSKPRTRSFFKAEIFDPSDSGLPYDRSHKTPSFIDLNIDGWPVTISGNTKEQVVESLASIQIATLKGLEIIYSKQFTRGAVQAPGGVPESGYRDYEYAKIEITTGNGAGWSKKRQPGTTTYRPLPLLSPQQFYSPKYIPNAPIKGEPDYRATLYWNPNITTDANGKAKVWFYTSDLPANYTINLQGMTTDGEIGGTVTKMPVNEAKKAANP